MWRRRHRKAEGQEAQPRPHTRLISSAILCQQFFSSLSRAQTAKAKKNCWPTRTKTVPDKSLQVLECDLGHGFIGRQYGPQGAQLLNLALALGQVDPSHGQTLHEGAVDLAILMLFMRQTDPTLVGIEPFVGFRDDSFVLALLTLLTSLTSFA